MEKVLLLSAAGITRGGVQKYLENQIECTNDLYNYTWYVQNGVLDNDYKNQLEQTGVKIVMGNVNPDSGLLSKFIRNFQNITQILKENKFDIIHSNTGDLFFNYTVTVAARKQKIKKIIVHSHNAMDFENKTFAKRVVFHYMKGYVIKHATKLAACSKKAAESLFFNENYFFVHNRIETSRFSYNPKIREQVREKYGIKDEICIGNIAAFNFQKNHEFLIKIFDKIHQKEPTAKLLLVGEGEKQELIQKMVAEKGLGSSVIFAGAVQNPQDYLMAMDLLCFPSLWEGLPISLLEAQTSGLICVVSDVITKQVAVTSNIEYLSLKEDENFWAKKILELLAGKRVREDCSHQVADAGFDLSGMREETILLYS